MRHWSKKIDEGTVELTDRGGIIRARYKGMAPFVFARSEGSALRTLKAFHRFRHTQKGKKHDYDKEGDRS